MILIKKWIEWTPILKNPLNNKLTMSKYSSNSNNNNLMIMLQIVQEIVGYFKHMDELDNLDRLKSLNVKIDLIRFNWIGLDWGRYLEEAFAVWGRYLEEVFGGGIWNRYLEEVLWHLKKWIGPQQSGLNSRLHYILKFWIN